MTFSVLLLAYTLSQFFRAFLAIVAADLVRDLGLDPAQLGDLSAIWFASFAIAQFPVGVALDRVGPRTTIAGFMLVAAAGAAVFASAGSFTGALVGMALIGVGCSPVLMGSLYVFGRVYPQERFAMLASLMIGIGSIGNLIGAAPLALAASTFGWRASLGAIAAFTLVSVGFIALFLKDPPRVDGPKPGDAPREGFMSLLAPGPLWTMLPLILVSYAFVIAIRSLWIGPFLSEVHGFDAVERGNGALVMAATMSIGALAYGPAERLLGSPRRTVLAGSVITGIALLALGALGARGAGLAIVLFAIVGATGLSYGILMAHARRFLPAHLLGRGVALLNFFFIGGAGIVQWMSGRFVRASAADGWVPGATFSALHLAFGALLLAATVVYAFSPEAPRRKAAAP
jgi:predicted MFS family arabinose efflux permease